MSIFPKKHKTFIGLAVQDNLISLVKLSQAGETLLLDAFFCEPVTDYRITADTIYFSAELIATLQTWVKQIEAKQLCAAVALPMAHVINKLINLTANLSDTECYTEIINNLDYYLPGLSQQLNIDLINLSDRDERRELLLFAARTEQITNWCQLAKQIDLRLTSIDVDAYAIVRAMLWSQGFSFQSCLIIVIHPKALMARLFLIDHRGVVEMTVISIQAQSRCVEQINEVMREVLTRDKFSSVQRIYLLDVGVWIDDELHQEWSYRVTRVNPFKHLKLSDGLDKKILHQHAADLLLAYGLALRGFAN